MKVSVQKEKMDEIKYSKLVGQTAILNIEVCLLF